MPDNRPIDGAGAEDQRSKPSAQAVIEGRVPPTERDRERQAAERRPAAGPHAEPDQTNDDATPDTGALTPAGQHDNVDSTTS